MTDTPKNNVFAAEEWEVSQAQLHSACRSFRHDFGLLDESQKTTVMFEAREWLTAWNKALKPAPKDNVEGDRFMLRESHFGTYIAPNMPAGCDMIVVYANKYEHVPVWVGLPHQLYTREARRLLAAHGGDHLTIVPYRNADKIDVPASAFAATTEGSDRE